MPSLDPRPEALPGHGGILVAFSGGPDSVCLLYHLLAARLDRPLTAVHVDHGLDPASGERAERAAAIARAMGAAVRQVAVTVENSGPDGMEAAARRARYALLESLLEDGDTVVTGHHADDQVETVMLRLLRGAGPEGLGGMRRCQRLGAGWLVRPLLDWHRDGITAWLRHHRLEWLEDPTNAETGPDRNFLRRRIRPLLERRWPGHGTAVLRSARLCAGAGVTLETLARDDLAACRDGRRKLRLPALAELDRFRRGNVLRRWCIAQAVEPPPARQLDEFLDQLARAGDDRQPELRWHAGEMRAWRGRLWLETGNRPQTPWQLDWPGSERLALPGNLGELVLSGPRESTRPRLQVCSGRPGERFRPAGSRHRQPVARLLAEHGVPPWRRDHWPRVYLDNRLVAVGSAFVSEALARRLADAGLRLEWRGPM